MMTILEKIKRKIKSKFDLINNEKLKMNLLNALPFWVGAFISGALAVLYAKLFSWAESGTHLIYEKANWTFFIITPVCFVLAWWIVAKYSPFARSIMPIKMNGHIQFFDELAITTEYEENGFRYMDIEKLSLVKRDSPIKA